MSSVSLITEDEASQCNCASCGLLDLYDGPVPPDGGDFTIMAVGEAPGEEEDKQGKPFVGRSGKLLRTTLQAFGFDNVTYTNIVRCRPPDNKIKAKHIKACYRSLPIRDNTYLVMLFGNTPLKAVLGESGITQWHGVVVERDGIVYVPLLHPAYILRNMPAMDLWLEGIDKAWKVWTSGTAAPADDAYEYINGVYTKPDVYRMCVELMESPVIAFDTEVAGLDAYANDNRVLVLSFATDSKAWSVPVNHPDDLAPIGDDSLDMILNVLEQHPCVIGHNIKFDQMQTAAMLGSEFDAGGDSMLASYLLESKAGLHGLKRLAGRYLGMFEYDRELREYVRDNSDSDPTRGGSYANIPLTILLPYAARDAAATFQLEPLLYEQLSDKQKTLYEQVYIPASNVLSRIQCNGIAVDYHVAERYRRVYTHAMNDTLDSIRDDRMVKQYVRLRSDDSGKPFEFNPGSWQQKAMVLYGPKYAKWLHSKWEPEDVPKWARKRYYGLKPHGYSDSGNPSTKRDLIQPYRDECPLVDDLVMYGMYRKMLGTYLEPVANGRYASDSDGRIRSSFNLHIVETGRLSSSDPNVQNIPTPEKEPGTLFEHLPIKNVFTHTWSNRNDNPMYEWVDVPPDVRQYGDMTVDVNDGWFVQVDYSGMELRVFASLARCESMIEIHRSGRDFHTMVGSMVSGLPYEQITRPMRYRYKWTNWTMLYMGSEYTMERLYGIPLHEGRAIKRQYFNTFPEVPAFQRECVEFARAHGYIETPFGNRRWLPDINSPERKRMAKAERESANTPVQGAAGLTTVVALIIIDQRMYEMGLKSMIVSTVHDSIDFDVYPGELLTICHLATEVMENVVSLAGDYMPGIDMSWLYCPLKADVEIGSHYGNLEKWDFREEQ